MLCYDEHTHTHSARIKQPRDEAMKVTLYLCCVRMRGGPKVFGKFDDDDNLDDYDDDDG